MITVGITGGIASGKSSVIDYLKKQKYPIFDSDACVHKILEEDIDIINQVSSAFDHNIVDTKKGTLSINRKKLSKVVFNDKEKLKRLEDIIHPAVKLEIQKFKKEFESDLYEDNQLIFLDVPLLFETGFDKECDITINISLPQKIQKQRFIERGGKEEKFQKIIENQMDNDEKSKKADYIIDNSKELDYTYSQLDGILEKVK